MIQAVENIKRERRDQISAERRDKIAALMLKVRDRVPSEILDHPAVVVEVIDDASRIAIYIPGHFRIVGSDSGFHVRTATDSFIGRSFPDALVLSEKPRRKWWQFWEREPKSRGIAGPIPPKFRPIPTPAPPR
jgi:hypothetical protein